MPIEFQCPQGHRLACPDEMAGRTARCPKCGVKLLVPQPSAAPAIVASGDSSGHSASESSALSDIARPSGDPAASSGSYPYVEAGSGVGHEPLMVFLCPNGHKLNSPIGMQGQRGKCPHCNAKFIIPTEEDEPSEGESPFSQIEELLETTAALEPSKADSDRHSSAKPVDQASESIPSPHLSKKAASTAPRGDAATKSRPKDVATSAGSKRAPSQPNVATEEAPPIVDPRERRGIDIDFSRIVGDESDIRAKCPTIGQRCRQLWAKRGEGARMELRLASGETLAPDFFALDSAAEACGLFALRDGRGGYLLTAVAWTAIEQITMYGVANLPEEMSE